MLIYTLLNTVNTMWLPVCSSFGILLLLLYFTYRLLTMLFPAEGRSGVNNENFYGL